MVANDHPHGAPNLKRKLPVGKTIGDTFGIIRDNFGSLYAMSLIVGLAGLPAAVLFPQFLAHRHVHAIHPIPAVIFELGAAVLMKTFVSLYVFAISGDGTNRVLQGGRFELGTALKAGLSRYLPMFVSSMVYYLMLVVGFVLLVVPGIIVGAVYGLAPTLCVIERQGPFASLSRSAFLTRDNRWRCFGVTLILLAVPALLIGIVGDALALLVGPLAKIFGTALVSVLMLPIFYVFPTALAFELKRLKEDGVPSGVAEVF